LARWGSGSAARAVYGGLVKWEGVDEHYLREEKHAEGEELEKLSKQCISYTIKPAQELSYMKVVILLTENKEKEVSSTIGMKLSTDTSALIKLRNGITRERISKMEVILAKIDEARQTGNKAE
jgi:diphosphomevalonate decarboxylase